MALLLLIVLGVLFFLIVKFTVAIATIVAIVMGTTTITALVCVWLGTSYFLKRSGYDPGKAQETYHRVNSDLKQISEELQEVRFELEEVEPYLRDLEFLRYTRQNPKAET